MFNVHDLDKIIYKEYKMKEKKRKLKKFIEFLIKLLPI